MNIHDALFTGQKANYHTFSNMMGGAYDKGVSDWQLLSVSPWAGSFVRFYV